VEFVSIGAAGRVPKEASQERAEADEKGLQEV